MVVDPKPRRRPFRFSLRTLLAFTLLVGALMGWVAKERRQSAYELEVAEELRKLSLEITFCGPYDLNEVIPNGLGYNSPPSQDWWRKFAQQVLGVRVLLISGRADLQSLPPLTRLHNLKLLWVESPSHNNLSLLSGLEGLESVAFFDTPISDLTPLTELENLKVFLSYSKEVRNLKPFAGLKNLSYINLEQSVVEDLTPLAELTELEEIHLTGASIRNLAPLLGLSKLRYLGIHGTPVAKGQVEAMQRTLPNCKIYHDPFP